MNNKKIYFMWFDKHIAIIIFISFVIVLISALSIYVTMGAFSFKGLTSFQSEKYLYFIFIFFFVSTRFTIKNNKLKRWYLSKGINLANITTITYDKNLHIEYTNKRGKQKKYTMYLIGLRNNREKYKSLLNDMIEVCNSESAVIDKTAEEILNSIYSARINPLKATDNQPLKLRGWLFVWKCYILISFAIQGFDAYKALLEFNSYNQPGWYQFNVFYNGIAIYSVIVLCIYLLLFIFSEIYRKWSVKAIIVLYILKAIVVTLTVVHMIYCFGPMYEYSAFIVCMLILGRFCVALLDSLIFIRYFTKSIRVKNTYIK